MNNLKTINTRQYITICEKNTAIGILQFEILELKEKLKNLSIDSEGCVYVPEFKLLEAQEQIEKLKNTKELKDFITSAICENVIESHYQEAEITADRIIEYLKK